VNLASASCRLALPRSKSVVRASSSASFGAVGGRSTASGAAFKTFVGFLTELQALGCHLYLHQQALDTSRLAGRCFKCVEFSPSSSVA